MEEQEQKQQKHQFKENAYFDSVTLMTISTRANELAGVKTAMIGMGTDMNLEVIRNVGLYTPALDHVTTGDLLIVLDQLFCIQMCMCIKNHYDCLLYLLSTLSYFLKNLND